MERWEETEGQVPRAHPLMAFQCHSLRFGAAEPLPRGIPVVVLVFPCGVKSLSESSDRKTHYLPPPPPPALDTSSATFRLFGFSRSDDHRNWPSSSSNVLLRPE